ncbi:MAG: nucleotide exchange factor GrpE [Oligoflexia bacterium]|nr:nucleotide exchange factor GrpE [Oligoflexia bacterium]
MLALNNNSNENTSTFLIKVKSLFNFLRRRSKQSKVILFPLLKKINYRLHRINANQNKYSSETQELLEKVFKMSRKNNLLQEELFNVLDKIEHKIDFEQQLILKLSENNSGKNEKKFSIAEKDLFEIIDCNQKLIKMLDYINLEEDREEKQEINKRILDQAILQKDIFCKIFNITSIATIGNLYNSESTLVVESVYDCNLTKGTIVEIISQGYLDSNGQLLRKAKVVVSNNVQISKNNYNSNDCNINDNLNIN